MKQHNFEKPAPEGHKNKFEDFSATIEQTTTRGETLRKGEAFRAEEIDFEQAVDHIAIHQGGKVAGSQFNEGHFDNPSEIVEMTKQLLPNKLQYDQFGRAELTLDVTHEGNEPMGWSGVKSIEELRRISPNVTVEKKVRIPGGIKAEEDGIKGAWYPETEIDPKTKSLIVARDGEGNIKNSRGRFVPEANIARVSKEQREKLARTNRITIIVEKDKETERPTVRTIFPGDNAPSFPAKINAENYRANTLGKDTIEARFWKKHAYIEVEKYNTEQSKQAESVRETPQEEKIEMWKPSTPEEKEATDIVRILQDAGAEAYFAGGYGRDLVMSEYKDAYPDFHFKPNDIDIAVNIPYEKVKEILTENGYTKFKETGGNFTVLNVIVPIGDKHEEFEVASFRTEGDYGQDRKPEEVEFTSDIREDAARRDFTIGGLYFDPVKKTVIDYVGGMEDIKRKVLRTIGSPYERLVKEDPLRMLRYVRFRTKYNMSFDREVQRVIRENAHKLHNLPAERFHGEGGEIDKILKTPRAAFGVIDMARLGIVQEILPELSATIGIRHTPEESEATQHKEGDVFRHELEVMRATSREEFIEAVKDALHLPSETNTDETIEKFYKEYGTEWAWAVLLHDVGKKETQEKKEKEGKKVYTFYGHEGESLAHAERVFARLNFSNKEQKKIRFLIENHMKAHKIIGRDDERLSTQKKNQLLKNEYAEELLFLSLADDIGNFTDNRSSEDKVNKFKAGWEQLQKIREEEKKRAEEMKNMKNVGQIIKDAFIPKGSKEGVFIIGPIKEMVGVLLDEGKITTRGIPETIKKIKDVLEQEHTINTNVSTKEEEKKIKARIRQTIANAYNIENE